MKQLQQQARVILNFKSDAKSIVKMKTKYDDWTRRGKMTVEEAAEEIKPDMDKAEGDMKTVPFFLILVKPPYIDHILL